MGTKLAERPPSADGAAVLRDKPVYDKVKRVLDVVLSVLALVVLFLPLSVVSLMIIIDDPGNPFYRQTRIGRYGKPFTIYKFRSMKKNADELKVDLYEHSDGNGANFKMDNDPRVTRLGRFLRRSSIDELPQLINIIKGDMSIIGPRPFIPEEQARLPDDRLSVLPGLSCYWQIGGKNSLSKEEQIALDRKYIEERSLRADIVICLKTVKAVVHDING